MKIIFNIFIFLITTNAFAKPIKVYFRVYACPKQEEVVGCPNKEVKVVDKDIEIKFEPLKDKNGVVEKEESRKHLFLSEKVNGLEFNVGARLGDRFLRKGKAETVAPHGIIVLNVRLSDYKNLHYSEHVYFTDKSINFFHIPLRTNDQKLDYFAELRSLN